MDRHIHLAEIVLVKNNWGELVDSLNDIQKIEFVGFDKFSFLAQILLLLGLQFIYTLRPFFRKIFCCSDPQTSS